MSPVPEDRPNRKRDQARESGKPSRAQPPKKARSPDRAAGGAKQGGPRRGQSAGTRNKQIAPSAGARNKRPRPAARQVAAGDQDGERLQRLISRAGRASRRKAEELIEARRVTVNGVVAQLGQRATERDDVRVDGKQLQFAERRISYLLNKPAGYVTTAKDERGRKTVMELLPKTPGLHPVGRLDRNSEGLMLLTTDGELTLFLTHPRYEVTKEYRVWCESGTVDGATLAKLEAGVMLEDGMARALRARPAPGGAVIVLAEGRKREVRRLFKAVERPVVRLVRVKLGELPLGDLPPGSYRELTHEDFALLGYTPGRRRSTGAGRSGRNRAGARRGGSPNARK